MIPVVTADEMRRLDGKTIRESVPGLTLMERAGKGVRDEILRRWKRTRLPGVVVVCGKGNNGGDGLVIARLLKKDGYRVKVYLVGKAVGLKGDAAFNLRRCIRAGIKPVELTDRNLPEFEKNVVSAGLVVDAIFGTGFEGKPEGLASRVIDIMNLSPAPRIAVDIPSGVNATTGEAEIAVDAHVTVTMGLPKRGHLLFPGKSLAGELAVVDIGIPPSVVDEMGPGTFMIKQSDVAATVPDRAPQAHKWSCGFVACISGSLGFTGAATLTAISALRAGAGLVTLAVPRSLNAIMEVKLTEVMTLPVDETPQGSLALSALAQLKQFASKADCVAIGPGLSQNEETVALVRKLVPDIGKPCVLDADGINAFAGRARELKALGFPLIVTPHAGEAARLLGVDKDRITADPIEFAREAAVDLGVVFVLKGAPTIIAGPHGKAYINPTGNQGLATAGSGDVLTGIVAGLVAQGVEADKAAWAGAYIHGACGDMLLSEKGYFGFLAGEVSEKIPEAIASIILD